MPSTENFEDAYSLIEFCKEEIERIKIAYDESLMERTIKRKLLIEVKNFVENLRSALDYTAHGLYDKYGISSQTNPKIFFPYAWETIDAEDFSRRKLIEKNIPGITINRPDIASKIESYQHFSNPDNSWFPKFMDLTNKNKHQKFTAQTKTEKKDMTTTLPNGFKISFGTEGGITANSFKFGDQVFEGKQTFNAYNPLPIKGAIHEIRVWTSFNFAHNNEPVLTLLEKSLSGVEIIVNELSAM